MPRRAAGLSAAKVRTAKPGRYGDGAGLYLLVRNPDAKFWLFRYTRGGRMREMGLGTAGGPAPVALADARVKARKLYDQVRDGRDPLQDRAQERAASRAAGEELHARNQTFHEVADLYIAAHEAGWRNPKHHQQWLNTLRDYAYPHMGDLPVADVQTAHVMAALEPIWREKPETASRVRGRIEAVLDYAKARDWRFGENPARWRGHVENMLPRTSKVRRVEHHPALPWQDIGAFMEALARREGIAALALRFAVLTAARSGEVRLAAWREMDLTEAVWTAPAEHMKAHVEHRVPLSAPALAVLREVAKLRQTRDPLELVFPGSKIGKPLSDMSLTAVLKRMGRPDITAHGFRSTFRDWVAESTDHPREIAEAALAHTLESKVEAAYRRGDLFEKRRRLMDDWAAFCAGPAQLHGEIAA